MDATTVETTTREIEHIPAPVENATNLEDEEYKWLTELLNAHTLELVKTREAFTQQLIANQEAQRNAGEESRTLIQALTQMVQTMSESLTGLAAASAMSRLTPPISENTLPLTEAEVTTIVPPESDVSADQTSPSETGTRKRRRL